MSIRQDLIGVVTGIIGDIAGSDGLVPCKVYFVKHETTNEPGKPSSDTYTPVHQTNAIDLKRVTKENKRRLQREAGLEPTVVYSCSIPIPVVEETT